MQELNGLHLACELTAYTMSLLSVYLYSRKTVWGPIVGALDIIPWTAIALYSGVTSMAWFNLIFLVLHVRAAIKWRREELSA